MTRAIFGAQVRYVANQIDMMMRLIEVERRDVPNEAAAFQRYLRGIQDVAANEQTREMLLRLSDREPAAPSRFLAHLLGMAHDCLIRVEHESGPADEMPPTAPLRRFIQEALRRFDGLRILCVPTSEAELDAVRRSCLDVANQLLCLNPLIPAIPSGAAATDPHLGLTQLAAWSGTATYATRRSWASLNVLRGLAIVATLEPIVQAASFELRGPDVADGEPDSRERSRSQGPQGNTRRRPRGEAESLVLAALRELKPPGAGFSISLQDLADLTGVSRSTIAKSDPWRRLVQMREEATGSKRPRRAKHGRTRAAPRPDEISDADDILRDLQGDAERED